MGIKDYFNLLKLNILKNSLLYLSLICWLVLYTFIQSILPPIIELSANDADKLLLPLWLLRFTFWILTFLVVKEGGGRFRAFLKRGNTYEFTSDSWYKDWIFNGKTRILEGTTSILQVNSSRAGCLLDRYTWKNFEMKFEMRFLSDHNFIQTYYQNIGIIFRAKDLENYFMLEVLIRENQVWLKPHIKYKGMWEALSKDKSLLLEQKQPEWITAREWFKVKVIVKENLVRLIISDMEEYLWSLPTHVDINHIESGIKEKQSVSIDKEEFGTKIVDLPKIDFKDSFGMLGFRAHLYQGADIKNLTVRNI